MKLLTTRGKRIRDLAFSPDGTRLASASGNGRTVTLWDLATGKRRILPRMHSSRVTCLAFSPDGARLASADMRGHICLWDVAAGVASSTLHPSGGGAVRCLAFSPDGQTLATGGDGYTQGPTIYRWDFKTRQWLPVLDIPHGRRGVFPVPCLAFSPDGRALASADPEPLRRLGTPFWYVRIWDLAGDKVRKVLLQRKAVYSLCYAPDGRTLAIATGHVVLLWDGQSDKEQAVLKGHTKLVSSIAFAPDGRTLLSASHDGTVRQWDVAAGRERSALNWQIGQIHVTAFAPNGMLAAAGGDGQIMVWDIDDLSQ
jgi:WD40 repeat protein